MPSTPNRARGAAKVPTTEQFEGLLRRASKLGRKGKASSKDFAGGRMLLETKKEFHALCYEHHVLMKLSQISRKARSKPLQMLSYACPKPGCAVHYSSADGYFTRTGNRIGREMTPGVHCPQDGLPMYLANVHHPEKRSFRLWRCPQCDLSRSNEQLWGAV